MRVLTVVGARPQFVKAAMLSRALSSAGIPEILVHTGQHYDHMMSGSFFSELELPQPAHHLGVGSGRHGEQTGRMLIALEKVMLEDRPDAVVVFGDTNSTMAGALAAAKLRFPLAHVEAGLRSRDRLMPEEINRIVTDHTANILFAPSEVAATNLRAEGLPDSAIMVVGDIMLDALRHFAPRTSMAILERLGLKRRGYVLATIHRASNTDNPDRLRNLMDSLSGVAKRIPVIVPLHPRTRACLLPGQDAAIRLIDPVGYLDMLVLEQHAAAVATDSGGVQKESALLGTPVVIMRNSTEWTELVDAGWCELCPESRSAGESTATILAAIGRTGMPIASFGNGHAARSIVQNLLSLTANSAKAP